jgi:hypothetical protein
MSLFEINIDKKNLDILARFFLKYPLIEKIEHYQHTRSPFDNLRHYMWEELQEHYHKSILDKYQEQKYLNDADITNWIEQELHEHYGIYM